jgi:hypothetical protein
MIAGSMRGKNSWAQAGLLQVRMWPARVATVTAPHTPQWRWRARQIAMARA